MIVVCLTNVSKSLPRTYLDGPAGFKSDREFPLTVGSEYLVHAVATRNDQVWYYVCDDDQLWFPVRYPADLFRVVDGRLPKSWRFVFTPENPDHLTLLTFGEWAAEEFFYDRLTDRKEREVDIFQQMKSLIQSEVAVSDRLDGSASDQP